MPPRSEPALSALRLRAPVNVTWEITEACNLSCSHCLSAGLRAQGQGELDLEQCRALVDELARMQVFQVNFGGGEPFLRDDFLDILDYAQRRGITTCVSTNGTLLTDALVDALLEMRARLPAGEPRWGSGRDQRRHPWRGDLRPHPRRHRATVRAELPRLQPEHGGDSLNVGEIAEFDRLARRYGAKTRLSRFQAFGSRVRHLGGLPADA